MMAQEMITTAVLNHMAASLRHFITRFCIRNNGCWHVLFFHSMDGIITFCPESISMSDVQTRINSAVATKVEISDVQRIVTASITDNTWPKTRSYSADFSDFDSSVNKMTFEAPANAGSARVVSNSAGDLLPALPKGVKENIYYHNNGDGKVASVQIMWNGTSIIIYRGNVYAKHTIAVEFTA